MKMFLAMFLLFACGCKPIEEVKPILTQAVKRAGSFFVQDIQENEQEQRARYDREPTWEEQYLEGIPTLTERGHSNVMGPISVPIPSPFMWLKR